VALKRLLVTVDSHTQGEPTRLVIGGIIHYPGESMKERQAFVAREYDAIRKCLMAEPRGHHDMFGGFITPPASVDGDVGVIFMDNQGYLDMCGHGTIGLCTTLVELGMVKPTPPRTEIKIDSPAGRVLGYTLSDDSRILRAGFQNVPAFCLMADQRVEVDGYGHLEVGIAYGGNFFAIVPAEMVGLELSFRHTSQIRAVAAKIKHAVNTQVEVKHPKLKRGSGIDIVTFYGPPDNAGATYKNVHVFADGQLDRSPGGTGTSAMLAYLFKRGEVAGCPCVTAQGLAGGLFEGKIVDSWVEDGLTYHTPEISGVAYLTGITQFYLDPGDPMLQGLPTNASA
jgi:proline racemase